jgi:hypothetical protein
MSEPKSPAQEQERKVEMTDTPLPPPIPEREIDTETQARVDDMVAVAAWLEAEGQVLAEDFDQRRADHGEPDLSGIPKWGDSE